MSQGGRGQGLACCGLFQGAQEAGAGAGWLCDCASGPHGPQRAGLRPRPRAVAAGLAVAAGRGEVVRLMKGGDAACPSLVPIKGTMGE